MKIHALRILSYGKFKDKTICFSDGINYIYGENEAGKSTIMAFIKAMLFGFSGRGADGDRKRYMPWDGGKLAGEMDVTLKNGKRVIVRRTSGRTQAQDEFVCLDAVTGESCAVDLEEEIGIGEAAFMKTVFIRQMGTDLGGGDDELTDKLIRLATSGDEDAGYEDAMKALQEKMRLLKHQRGDGGRIHELKKGITDLSDALERAEEENKTYIGFITEEKTLRTEIAEIQDKIRQLEEGYRAAEAGKAYSAVSAAKTKLFMAEEKYKEAESALRNVEEKQKELSAFETEIADAAFSPGENTAPLHLQIEKVKQKKTLLSVSALISVIAGVVLSALRFIPFGIGLIGIGLLLFILGIKQGKTKKAIEEKLSVLTQNEDARKAALEAFGCNSLKEYTEKRAEKLALDNTILTLKEKYNRTAEEVKNAEAEVQMLNKALTEFEGIAPSRKDVEQITSEINALQKELSEKTQRAATVKGVLQGAQGTRKPADLLLTERRCAEEALAEAEEEFAALKLASDILEEVFAELSRDFTPRINEKASAYLSTLTGKEETLLLDKKFAVTMGRGEHRPLKAFSGGTMDQAFLAVRLAIADFVLEGNNVPIFLDDIFMQYDVCREENAFRLLEKIAKEKQVILFSCRPRERENMTSIKL